MAPHVNNIRLDAERSAECVEFSITAHVHVLLAIEAMQQNLGVVKPVLEKLAGRNQLSPFMLRVRCQSKLKSRTLSIIIEILVANIIKIVLFQH